MNTATIVGRLLKKVELEKLNNGKKIARVAVEDNEQNSELDNGICTWHFLSIYLGNPSYMLRRISKRVFLVERVEEQGGIECDYGIKI